MAGPLANGGTPDNSARFAQLSAQIQRTSLESAERTTAAEIDKIRSETEGKLAEKARDSFNAFKF